jgi:hypothetical protein
LIGRAPLLREQQPKAGYDQPAALARIPLGDDACSRRGESRSPSHRLLPILRGFVRQFTVFEDGPSVWERLIMLSRRYSFAGRRVHDANIVATMLAHGERRF